MPTKKHLAAETERLRKIFQAAHARITGSSTPEIEVSFHPFAGLKHSARLRQGKLFVKISDIFADAPAEVLEATARLLLSKLYRKRLDKKLADVYRFYVTSRKVLGRIREARRERGRAPSGSARGRTYDLAEIFDRLNRAYFSGRLAVKVICWSRRPNRRQLGRYDAAHDAIVISQHLDSWSWSWSTTNCSTKCTRRWGGPAGASSITRRSAPTSGSSAASRRPNGNWPSLGFVKPGDRRNAVILLT